MQRTAELSLRLVLSRLKRLRVAKFTPESQIRNVSFGCSDPRNEGATMATYLLTWNPRKFNWTSLIREARNTKRYHRLQSSWSCGNTKKIDRGHRFFVIRLSAEPRGIFASGVVASLPYRAGHWSRESGKTANFVDVIWDTLLVPGSEPILPITYLKRAFGRMHWEPQASGAIRAGSGTVSVLPAPLVASLCKGSSCASISISLPDEARNSRNDVPAHLASRSQRS
jgi:hypothetical protein